jgi:hypothetical protein
MSPRRIHTSLSYAFDRIVTIAFLSTLINASGIFAAEEPVIHTVYVGNGGDNQYHPNVTYANVGDIVIVALICHNAVLIRR